MKQIKPVKTCQRLGVVLILPLLVVACGKVEKESETTGWSADHLTTLEGFKVPECAVFCEETGLVHVSNIESPPDEYWSDDGKGHLSAVNADFSIKSLRWIDSGATSTLNSPKGMCVLEGHLYFTDNTRLMRCSVVDGDKLEVVAEGFTKANDLATDGERVWLSDTGAGKVYAISPDGGRREVPSPEAVNGITFFGKKLFAVSWGLHEVYELDPLGEKQPVSFGLAEHFTNLDGIEVLEDGTFIVSDFMGNKVSTISPDRRLVETLIELESPADIGLNRKDGLLYVPQFMVGKLAVYRLKKE